MHVVNTKHEEKEYQQFSSTLVAPFLYSAIKRVKHCLSSISKGISDHLFIALYFSIFAPEFESDFSNAHFRILVCLDL